jgi:glycosyltransferase involved in cell wall biosynthesis
MNVHPTVSIVTPSFNQVTFVERTIRSVIDQQYPGLEYVIIDGGSTDGSREIIEQYQQSLSYCVSEPDRGHAHALNKGFARTTGDIMGWINSSDTHYPWTLQTVAEIFTQLPQVAWIMGIPTELGCSDGPLSVSPAHSNVYDILAGDYRRIQQESVFWRRSLWEEAGGALDETLRAAADFDLWLRFFRLADLFHVQTILAGFRVHEDRLANAEEGLHARESAALQAAFAATVDPRTRRRAALVKALGSGRGKIAARALGQTGVWPWYRHPQILFDFDRSGWVLH